MKVEEMTVPGSFRITPQMYPDDRGTAYELYRNGELGRAIGRRVRAEQIYCSVSRRNTIRGIHGTVIPPGMEKFVTCVRGRVLDVVVDLRVGSPAFGRYAVTVLDELSATALYIPDGIGHAFLALSDEACLHYLCSTEYVPGTMLEINALDPGLGLPWDLTGPPVMSAKDAAAPTLAQARAAGLLPSYETCLGR